MDKKQIQSFIWPQTNRIVHILLIALFAASYLLGEAEKLLKFHAIFGILLGLVIFFRIIWGYIGPKYSRFKDFNFNKNDLITYLSSPFSNAKKHIGHNPASSWAIVLMFLFGIIATITGMLTYGAEQHHGIFAFMYSESLKELELFEELHEFFSNAFLAIIIIHVIGTIIDRYIKKNDGIDSMISGYKQTEQECSIKTNIFQKIFSALCLIAFLFILFYLIFNPQNIFIANSNF